MPTIWMPFPKQAMVPWEITSGGDGTNITTPVAYTSAAFDMEPGELFLAAFVHSRNAGSATVSHVTHSGGATFDEVRSVQFGGGNGSRLALYRCQPTTSYAGGTLDFRATPNGITMLRGIWHIIKFTGAFDDSAGNGAGAILESADRGTTVSSTSSTVTLTTGVNAPDAIYAAWAIGLTNSAATPGATYTELADTETEGVVLMSEHKDGDGGVDADASWINITSNQGIAVAVKSA